MASHVNGAQRLFGGKLMEWIDITAAVEARRHAHCDVTLAAVDPLEFIKPVQVNDTVVLEAEVTWTGRTSIEVRVDTFVEHLNQNKQQVNRAYLVFVAVDSQNNPQPVPSFEPQTEYQRREFENASLRRSFRLKLRQEAESLQTLSETPD
jgi:acyl-CoA hydrolase